MVDDRVSLNYSYCMEAMLGPGKGLTEKDLIRLQGTLDGVHLLLEQQRKEDKLGFWRLPAMSQEALKTIISQAERLKSLADDLVVLGIGGSTLGIMAVDMALSGILRQFSSRSQKNGMRIFISDNPDPRVFVSLLNKLDLSRTAFNVVSKSGSTAETMAQFMVILDYLESAVGKQEAVKRLIFTTDPHVGTLRFLAQREPYQCLSVPSNVGGRYSLLSAAGLFPLACAGHNISALLKGAADMVSRCEMRKIQDNPAYLFAAIAINYLYMGRNILVIMPYATDLFGLAQWFAQLWAESLGKARALDGTLINVGQTPIPALGVIDQHSQFQLYIEGPQDKLICFIVLDNYGIDVKIPVRFQHIDSLAYLCGSTMSKLIHAEARATAVALAQDNRPSITIHLPELNEEIMGQIIFLFEAATVASGGVLKVNPLDQPGVDLTKRLTYSLMGRKGFESVHKKLMNKIINNTQSYIV